MLRHLARLAVLLVAVFGTAMTVKAYVAPAVYAGSTLKSAAGYGKSASCWAEVNAGITVDDPQLDGVAACSKETSAALLDTGRNTGKTWAAWMTLLLRMVPL